MAVGGSVYIYIYRFQYITIFTLYLIYCISKYVETIQYSFEGNPGVPTLQIYSEDAPARITVCQKTYRLEGNQILPSSLYHPWMI